MVYRFVYNISFSAISVTGYIRAIEYIISNTRFAYDFIIEDFASPAPIRPLFLRYSRSYFKKIQTLLSSIPKTQETTAWHL